MRTLTLLLLLALGVVMRPSDAVAHPGHGREKPLSSSSASTGSAPPRPLTIQRSGATEHGTLVMARDGLVQIRLADDSLVTVPLSQLSADEQEYVEQRLARIRADVTAPLLLAQAGRRGQAPKASAAPAISAHFDPFVKLKAIRTRWDDRFFYVESNGIPAHQMMVGITAWQQQVPLPQKYTGDNAWQIPLHPVPAAEPAMANDRFLRGAIALAVNGIPIFNPLNNRGDDAYLFGELDEFGGHCGRADDYHYHIAPVHLQDAVGKDQPIAYALDGYPIYGYQDEKSPDFAPLDKLSGHKDKNGNYHYHATRTYPYLNGGFYGEVVERDGQVDPQPRAEPLRPALPPLRDARITKFEEVKPGRFRLTYDVRGKTGSVSYTLNANGSATFEFVDTDGRSSTETYTPRRRGPGGGNPPPPRPQDAPPPGGNRPPRKNDRPPGREPPAGQEPSAKRADTARAKLELSSSSIGVDGRLVVDCTCDGQRHSPAIAWKGAPAGTKAFAVSLWHTAPDQEKSYWLVYNIPAASRGFAQNARPEGTLGLNDRRKPEYDPMCSKGPGIKKYHLTVFALSRPLTLPAEKVTRATLLEAIQETTLAEGTLDFEYERKGS